MELRMYQVDAFASAVFKGNPAAVCPLEQWLPDKVMQSIANENNLAETAFFVKKGDRYQLRWFTPEVEVDLCGHATLASAYVIFRHLEPELERVAFDSQSGELVVTRESDLLSMDFPAWPPQRVEPKAGLLGALGGNPKEVFAAQDYVIVYGSEEEVSALRPNMLGLYGLDRFAVIVTAPGSTKGVDFVSRFFAPEQGVAEDPVTGRAHCSLIPYWAERLGKTKLSARQVSARGGELECELRGKRVKIAGHAVQYLHGHIEF